MIELFASALSFMFLFMILDAIFGSTQAIMFKQQAFEGRLIFFIYSMLVYYNNIKFNIFLWDTLINEPIIQAYNMLDGFLMALFNISIANDPGFIFKYLIVAGFIFNFVTYWFSFGFGDKRISKMIGLAAVMLFLSSNSMGLIKFITVPLGGIPFGSFLVFSATETVPTLDVSGEAIYEGADTGLLDNFGIPSIVESSAKLAGESVKKAETNSNAIVDFASGIGDLDDTAKYFILVVLLLLGSIAYYIFAVAFLPMTIEPLIIGEYDTLGLIGAILFAVVGVVIASLLFPVIASLVIYGDLSAISMFLVDAGQFFASLADGTVLNYVSTLPFAPVVFFVLAVLGLGLISEIFMFGAIYLVSRNFRQAAP